MKKVIFLFALSSLLLAIFISCSKKESTSPASTHPVTKSPSHQVTELAEYGDAYIEASIGDASYLNPVLAADSASGDINGLVYNGLVKYDKNIKLIGDLAESWEVKKNGLEIIFHLRKNVSWHDDKPFTSEDVKFTYEKLIDPKVKTPYSADYLLVKKLETPGPYTVKVIYKEPFAPALESWGMGIIPKHIFAEGDFNTHPANRHPIGTGPYKFKEWKTDEKIVLEANPDYFEEKKENYKSRLYPYINRFVYRIIPDQAVQFLELRRESIDSMGLTPDQYKAYPEFFKKYNKFRYSAFAYTYLGYSLRNPLFKEKKVRQAIAYAINKKEIVDGVLLGLGKAATGPYPPSSWAYNPKVKDYEYNPEKAKQLLAECGWIDSDGDGWLEFGHEARGSPRTKFDAGQARQLSKFEFTLTTNQGNKARQLCAEIIQMHLKKIGIKVNIRILEWSAFIHQYIEKRNFDAVILGWSLSRDPDQYAIWHSSQKEPGKYNFISYENSQVDQLLEEGRKTFDLEKRKKIYWRIHEILNEEQPYCFLYYPEALPVVHKRFQGPEVAPLGLGWNFVKWYVPKSQQKYLQ